MGDCGLFFVHAAHVAPARAAVQHAGQFRELLFRTYRVNLHAAVVQVAHVAGHAQRFSGALREIAVSQWKSGPSGPR